MSSVTTNNLAQDNKENVALIWFDPAVNSSDDLHKIKEELHAVNSFIRFPTDIDACINSIKSIKEEKIFLILSSNNAFKLMPKISDPTKLYSVFIFPATSQEHQRLLGDYPMIAGLFDNHINLIQCITENIKFVNKQMEVTAFYDQHQRGSRALSEHPADFLWFQLFKYVIQQLPDCARAKEDMVEASREYYRGNARILKDIDDFDTNYHEDECIQWYTKETFVYRLINKALRTEDIEQLYLFRYYILDLSKQLTKEYEKIKAGKNETLHLYRGAAVHRKEIENLKANIGKLIACNGYLSCSCKREIALGFTRTPPNSTDIVGVLFQIECDLKNHGDSMIVADLSKLSTFKEEEYLFDADSIFCVGGVSEKKEGDEDLVVVQMITDKKGREQAKAYIEDCQKEMKYESPTIMLGILLRRLGHTDKSLRYFERLLHEPGEEKVSHIYNRMSGPLRGMGECDYALDCLEKAYELISKSNPPEKVYEAFILHNKGKIFCRMRENEKALQFYTKAMKILEKEIVEPNRYIADVYRSVGRHHCYKKDFKNALKYNFQALKVRQACLTSDSVLLAFNYGDIANTYSQQCSYDEALHYHQMALELRKRFLPAVHNNTAWSLYQIGKMYYELWKFNEALEHDLLALDMIHKCSSYTKQDRTIRSILEHIKLIYQNQPSEALTYTSLVLQIHENIAPIVCSYVVKILFNISLTYQSSRRFEESLDFHKEALKIQLHKKLVGELNLAREFHHLARQYEAEGKTARALECYEEVMDIDLRYYYPDHPLCRHTQRNIDRIRRQHQYEPYQNAY